MFSFVPAEILVVYRQMGNGHFIKHSFLLIVYNDFFFDVVKIYAVERGVFDHWRSCPFIQSTVQAYLLLCRCCLCDRHAIASKHNPWMTFSCTSIGGVVSCLTSGLEWVPWSKVFKLKNLCVIVLVWEKHLMTSVPVVVSWNLIFIKVVNVVHTTWAFSVPPCNQHAFRGKAYTGKSETPYWRTGMT
jgi:hypothetical protein